MEFLGSSSKAKGGAKGYPYLASCQGAGASRVGCVRPLHYLVPAIGSVASRSLPLDDVPANIRPDWRCKSIGMQLVCVRKHTH